MRAGRKRKTKVTLPAYNGDHGPGTQAACAGTVLEAVEGQEANRICRRRRKLVYAEYHRKGKLTLRQFQALKEISEAFAATEKSGGGLAERVDSSPKPDATIDVQIDAMSRFHRAMKAVPAVYRRVVERVCFYNLGVSNAGGRHYEMMMGRLEKAADLVADHLRY